jgi:hypothetical protein
VNEPIAMLPLLAAPAEPLVPAPPPPPAITYVPVIAVANGFVSLSDDVTTRVHVAAPVQTPPEHACPARHTVPHAPQFMRSIDVLVQTDPQTTEPVGHAHAPPLHVAPRAQT